MRAADPRHVVASSPAAGTQDFYVSGFAEHEEELGGTASITDEPAGSGRVVLFASEPNFRAYTTGTQKVLWNTLFGADPWHASAAKARTESRLAMRLGTRLDGRASAWPRSSFGKRGAARRRDHPGGVIPPHPRAAYFRRVA